MDIVWLQRDLGLYIVGLFDTYHAARALTYPQASLAFLLRKFINFEAQKQYQMADWRVRYEVPTLLLNLNDLLRIHRPLGKALFEYARADTHFLLYIFDCMRNELLEASNFETGDDKIRIVLENSRKNALQRYQHPIYDIENGLGNGGWHRALTRTPVVFTREQFGIFKATHQWRDKVARLEDESTPYVLPNHALFSIARASADDATAIFKAAGKVTPILRMHVEELVSDIAAAKVVAKNGPQLHDELIRIDNLIKQSLLEEDETNTDATAGPSAARLAAPALPKPAPVTPAVTQNLRATKSHFWGGLLPRQPEYSALPALDVQLVLPLPPLSAQVFTDPKVLASAVKTMEEVGTTVISDNGEEQNEPEPNMFIVKQAGGSRKRTLEGEPKPGTSSLAQPATTIDEDPDDFYNDEVERAKAAKAARKAAKKEKKRQARAAAAVANTLSGNGGVSDDGDGEEAAAEDEAPFDYANATSVLRAQQAEIDAAKKNKDKDKSKKKKKDQGFNPYAKMADVPKGLPRSQRETAGKSKTFTS